MTILRTLSGPAAWIIGRIQSIPRWMFSVVGLVLLFGGLVLATLVDRKDLAVALTFATSTFGAAILSLYLPQLLASVIDDEQEKARRLEQQLEAETTARRAQEKLREAEREIARLERMQLSLQALTPIANLSLLSVEMIVKDFCRRAVGEREKPQPVLTIPNPFGDDINVTKPWQRPKQISYTGAAEISVTAQLGVDLQKVQIWTDANGRLIIGGFSMTTTTDNVSPAEFPLYEVRTEIYDGDKVVEVEIHPTDQRLIDERDKHERQLRERIRSGQTFTVFEKSLLQAAREVLSSLLSPLGREITFAEKVPPDSQPLFFFLAEEQKKIEQRRKELEASNSRPANANKQPGPT